MIVTNKKSSAADQSIAELNNKPKRCYSYYDILDEKVKAGKCGANFVWN